MSKKNMVLGKMMDVVSFILLLPLPFIPFFTGEFYVAPAFIIPFFTSIIIAFVIDKIGFRFDAIYSTVTFIWLYGFLLLSFPFFLSGDATFITALFESVSGLTTTGLSVLDVENLPKTLLLYRAVLQYIGGLGFVMMILLFYKGREEAELYEAEGHKDKVRPSIRKTAKAIGLMYFIFLILGTFEYKIAGMTTLDSVVHSMCALSTGGFSNKALSIGAYDSVSVEIITSQLMILGTLDFSLLLTLFTGRIRDFFRSTEIKTFLSLLSITSALMVLILLVKGYDVPSTLRITLFNTLSALSTTGFSTLDYTTLPEEAVFVMILLMVIGGGMGSTAGGIKLERFYIIFKSTTKSIKEKIYPAGTVFVDKMVKGRESNTITLPETNEAFTYFSLYMLFLLFGTITLSLTENCPILYALFEYISSLSTVGLSMGVTNSLTSPISLTLMMVAMIMGRLEMMVVFQALFSKKEKEMKYFIESERLKIRRLEASDLDNLKATLQDERAMYAYEGAFSEEECVSWLNRQLERYREYGLGLWAVEDKNTNEFLGQCGLTYQPWKDEMVLEIGYLFPVNYCHPKGCQLPGFVENCFQHY